MAPAAGFEPATKWLTATYSTAELCRSVDTINIEGSRRKASGKMAFFSFFSIFFCIFEGKHFFFGPPPPKITQFFPKIIRDHHCFHLAIRGAQVKKIVFFSNSVCFFLKREYFIETKQGAVAQLARAIRSHRIGRGFDSHLLHHPSLKLRMASRKDCYP